MNLFRVLMIYLQPVLPDMAVKAQRFFQESGWVWASSATPLLGSMISPYEPLATRLDPKAVARLVQPEGAAEVPAGPVAATPAPVPAAATAPAAAPKRNAASGGASDAASLAAAAAVEGNMISIDDFLRVDLRVAKVLGASLVDGRRQAAEIASRCGRAWRA